MYARSLSVAMLAAALMVPLAAAPASAAGSTSLPTASGVTAMYKTSAVKRAPTAPAAPTLTYSDKVLTLTNAERTSRGLRPVAFSPCADGYADAWATRLSSAGSLAHQALSPILGACGARSVGENVAYGNVTPEQLVTMWMNSPGHRANLLNTGFTHLGVGAVSTSTGRVYGVQVFVTV